MANQTSQSLNSKILLLGGGYTLKRLAEILPKDNLTVTTTSLDKLEHYRAEGFNAALLNIYNIQQVDDFFGNNIQFDIIIDSIPPHWETRNPDIHELNRALSGVKNLAKVFAVRSPKRLVYLSTTGVYGVRDGSVVNEQIAANPSSVQAQARLQIENIYSALHIPFTALRISAIYGPGRTPLESIKAGHYPFIETGIRWSNRIHVDDLVQIILACINHPLDQALPVVMNVSDGNPLKNSEIIKYICERYDLPRPKPISLNEAQARGLHTLLNNQKIDNSLLLKTLNIKLNYDSILDFLG